MPPRTALATLPRAAAPPSTVRRAPLRVAPGAPPRPRELHWRSVSTLVRDRTAAWIMPRQRVVREEDVRAGAHVRRDRHREVVRERQRPEDPVVRPERQDVAGRRHPREHVRVREDDALAVGRRPGREPHEGRRQPPELGRARPCVGSPREHRLAVVRNHERGVDIGLVDDRLDLRRPQRRRDRHDARAGAEDPERRGNVTERVAGDEPDPLRRPHAARAQAGRECVGTREEIGVRERPPARELRERGPRPVACGGRGEHVEDRHRPILAASRPAASPVARHVPITRADPIASCVALMQRPAANRFAAPRDSRQPRGTS